MGLDEADPAHVGRKVVDVLNVPRGLQTIGPSPEVQELEFLSRALLVLGNLDVDSPHPVVAGRQVLHEVMSDEAARAGHENSLHGLPPSE